MKPNLKTDRDHWFYLVLLVGLILAAIVLWFSDPSHQPTGVSRIPWPVWPQTNR
jgi:hypothetical protein